MIFDIGANTGIYSLTANAINKKAKIYAFEPAQHFYDKLTTNNSLNNSNIICEPIAISNTTGYGTFYDVPQKNATAASLSPDKLKNAEWYKGEVIEYEVPIITLSRYIEENDVKGMDLLKLDIELHELQALEGLGKYLQKFKPVIIIEVLTKEMADKLNRFFNLEEYYIFHLKNSSQAEPVSKFGLTNDVYETHEWNYLIFHKSLEPMIKKTTSLYKNIRIVKL